jgi:hypothetical protein
MDWNSLGAFICYRQQEGRRRTRPSRRRRNNHGVLGRYDADTLGHQLGVWSGPSDRSRCDPDHNTPDLDDKVMFRHLKNPFLRDSRINLSVRQPRGVRGHRVRDRCDVLDGQGHDLLPERTSGFCRDSR